MLLEPKFSANVLMFVRLVLIFKFESVSCVVFIISVDSAKEKLTTAGKD